MRRPLCATLTAAAVAASAWGLEEAGAAEITVEMRKLTPEGTGEAVGTLTLRDRETMNGLLIQPALHGLPPGPHGFHVHQNPSCAPSTEGGETVPGGGAGPHLDPGKTGRHAGPYMEGHLGDLPVIWVGPDGEARTPVFAPRLTADQLRGHALILHVHGDNYSDQPELGGAGARLACAVVE